MRSGATDVSVPLLALRYGGEARKWSPAVGRDEQISKMHLPIMAGHLGCRRLHAWRLAAPLLHHLGLRLANVA